MKIYEQDLSAATAVTDKAPIGYVHSIETFGSVDGPGIRYVAFLQGCRMRCQFCHNPDTWNIGTGDEVTADEMLADAKRYRAFWGTQGGITTSGGEALLQIDFILDLFKKAKADGITTCLDTCGQPFTRKQPWFGKFEELMKYTDISMVDIKQINPREHKRLTGWSNENIFDMLDYMLEHDKHVWIRHVLVPQRTDYDYELIQIGNYIKTIAPIVDKVEILPYHTMGVPKYEELGIKYPLDGIEPPTTLRVKNAERLLHTSDYTNYKNFPNY
ncbi:pyruvate formate-lyase-activating protein [Loigolactobacillus backii]|uniref:Pyruvate formate-lyase-activating enzyme n=1 Tax=Loigolactobacillus backii TaxID=375175 RepID=A0A192H3W9_9LACO|nr:pyruvate formate-lyase-activating protein [Loigolactobacillus backii]ANK59490.1 pyruvate formate lyase-activating enzyme 1 [Loigolactobacillus backii]ANK62948.1 pyruvate formate lyase-activating enzyme 1 [Loigolactobacillus backii]ANK64483.1 pyruvate formate lyase-activating enzyme 1 [Loigolactobacillus backii]ANK67121.1 pyruvate formate lyase-activating enzyme 1 [Loigolactobacillus backii]ANK70044.1 pyruvate formate lyase-activating enzyme 1 [Loigolactobacillus backii]